MSETIEYIDNPDFFKEFLLEEAPVDKTDKSKDSKGKDEEKIEEIDPEELKKELGLEEAEPETEETEEVEDTNNSYSFKPFIDIMAEQGVLDLVEGEEVGDTAEDLVKTFETTVYSRIEKGIEDYKESIPEIGKLFLDFVENGGDPRKFLEVQSAPLILDQLDLDDESDQKRILTEFYKTQDMSDEEIKEQIQDFEDSLLLEKQSKLAYKKMEKHLTKQADNLIKEQEAHVVEKQKAYDNYIKSVKSTIVESKEIAGLEVSDKEKKEFEDYLLKRDKEGLTKYQRELGDNPVKTQVELAYLKFKKYDFNKVSKKAESTAAKKLRDTINKTTETTLKGSSANDNSKPADFSAFGKIFKNNKN